MLLDGVQPKEDPYGAFIDDEQLDWIRTALRNHPTGSPVLVLSHIPILSLTAITYGKPRALERRGDDTTIKAASMHTDGDTLHELFSTEGVKLCLSGHQHLLDHCTTDGVTSIWDGAVSAAWWKGVHQGVPEGYGLIDLFEDGTFEHPMSHTAGWYAAEPSASALHLARRPALPLFVRRRLIFRCLGHRR